MLEAEGTCSLKDAAQEPSLSAFLSDTEELFAFRYNLMQSQVFRAFHPLFSPAFLHARCGAEPVQPQDSQCPWAGTKA